MKKILIALMMLLGASNIINCMEQKEEKFEYFQYLPPELRCKIITTILEENLEENIDKWDDIFNFDRNSLKEILDRITLVSKDFNVLGRKGLKKFVRNLKQNRFECLQKSIRERYKNLLKEDLNKKLRDLLHLEITQEDLEESVRLIIAGADIDSKDNDGCTALMCAASMGHTAIVRLLVAKGAAIDSKGYNGWTALMFAVDNGHTEIARILIDKGAAIDSKNTFGFTALMWAARGGRTEIVRLLIAEGADIDSKDIDGWTALKYAQIRRCPEIVSLLSKKD